MRIMGIPTDSIVTVKKFFTCRFRELLHTGIISGTFNTAVPASVVVGTVAVVFAVRFVVLVIVRDEVVEGEAVVTRHEIDALLSLAFLMTVNCRATEQAVGKASHRILFAAKKAPNIVSKPPVPLLPTVADEAADLVEAGRIPGLGDELRPRQLPGPIQYPTIPADSASIAPDSSRARIAARSNRKPSTCISSTQ